MESHKFGTYLRRLRLSQGLTQTDLAKHLNIHPSQVSAWENAFRSPSARSLARLSDALNTDLRKWFLSSRDTEDLPTSAEGVKVAVTFTFNEISESKLKELMRAAGVAA